MPDQHFLRTSKDIKNEKWEAIKENIFYRLISIENKGILKDVIQDKFLNMNKIYYVGREYEFIIHKHQLKMWDISEEELKAVAEQNMQKESIEIKRIAKDYIKPVQDKYFEWFFEGGKQILDREEAYVMKNNSLKFGATALCNKEALRKFAEEQEDDLIILPRSVEEIIVIVNRDDFSSDIHTLRTLRELMYGFNFFQSPEDSLSYCVYEYLRSSDILDSIYIK